MALSTCSACKSNSFELVETRVANTNFRQFFIQCAHCGAPISSTGYFDIGQLQQEILEKFDFLESRLSSLENLIRNLR